MKPFNLEEYLANPKKKLRTRDGRKVTRVLCTDARGSFPVAALVEKFDRLSDIAYSYTSDGHYYEEGEHAYDLVFDSEKHEGWANVYKFTAAAGHMLSPVFTSEEDAKNNIVRASNFEYVNTIKVEWEE